MKADQQKTFQRCRIYLQDNLDPERICDVLHSKEVLTVFDMQRIDAEKTPTRKCNTLVDILAFKPDEHYDIFLTVLRDEKYQEVAKKLEKERLNHQEDPNDELLEDVQEILLSAFEEQEHSSISSEEIINDVTMTLRQRGKYKPLHNADVYLQNLLQRLFSGVKISPISPRKGTSSLSIKGLWWKNKSDIKPMDISCAKGHHSEEASAEKYTDIPDALTGSETVFSQMDKNSLHKWLTTVFQNIGIDIHVADDMKDEEIDGAVFEKMTLEEMKEFVDKFGHRKKIQIARDEYIKEIFKKTSEPFAKMVEKECPRRFDETVKITDKYCTGRRIELETRITNLIRPVKFAYLPELGYTVASITQYVVKFGSACMNERTNGTLYIGITEAESSTQEPGTVIGFSMNKQKEELDKSIQDEILKSFCPDQISIAMACIRPPQIIEVMSSKKAEKKFVVEIDIVPSHISTKLQAFFLKNTEEPSLLGDLYRIKNDRISAQNQLEIAQYMEEKSKLSEERDRAEKSFFRPRTISNIHKKIEDFLCCGEDQIEPSISPILVLGPIDDNMDNDFLVNNFSALKNIPWRAVIDFEMAVNQPMLKVMEDTFSQVYLMKNVKDFDEKESSLKDYTETLNSLKESKIPAWIVANDLPEDTRNVAQWKRECSRGFRKLIEFYESELPKGRVRVVIFLLSKYIDHLVEASEEILLRYETNCLIVSDAETVMFPFKEKIQSKHCIEQYDLNAICVDDLPWNLVNETLRRIAGHTPRGESLIYSSLGPPCILTNQCKAAFCDLEILGTNECEYVYKNLPEEDVEKEAQAAAEKFYRGGEVQWINFYFDNQVLEREKHDEISRYVSEAIKDSQRQESENRIKRVTIYHQPGAGGTTTAKHILWENRKTVRCCIVRKISSQTSKQICKFKKYGNNTQPVLVLLDNLDDDKIAFLFEQLSDETVNSDADTGFFCVFLVCYRRPVLPFEHGMRYIMLNQKLESREVSWLKRKHKDLLTKYNEKKGCNPKSLLSFNIMKENFDLSSIDRTIKEFVQDRQLKPLDLMLIKYVAFLNSFDLQRRTIPVSCFDHLFGVRAGWEKRICQTTRVLLTSATLQGIGGSFPGFRVAHALLSKPIIHAIVEVEKEKTHKHSTIGEIAMDIVSSRLFIKNIDSFDQKKIRSILRTVVKKREWRKDTEELEFFSPLVTELIGLKDMDTAVKFSQKAFEIADDSGIAQQLARLFIHLEQWEKAKEYADMATLMSPNNSSYLHTYGQIYNKKQKAIIMRYHHGKHITVEDVEKCILNTQLAIERYQRVQWLSAREDVPLQNLAGQHGEIRTIFDMLEGVEKLCCFKSRADVRRYLTDKRSHFDTGLPPESEAYLISLGDKVYNAIESLHHLIQQAETFPRPFYNQAGMIANNTTLKDITTYKETYSSFFGLDGTETSRNASPVEKMEYHRRYVKNKGATSLLNILRLRGNSMDELKEIRKMMLYNVQSNTRSYDSQDWRVAISLMIVIQDQEGNSTWNKLMEYSRKLYDMTQQEVEKEHIAFEVNLFVTMIHWPLPSRRINAHQLMAPYLIGEALQKWQQRVKKLPSKRRNLHKALFFLTTLEGTKSIAVFERDNLMMGEIMNGKLSKTGKEVQYTLKTYQGNDGPVLKIPLTHPVKDSLRWNRSISFYLLFGMHGPQAEAILEEKKRKAESRLCSNSGHSLPQSNASRLDFSMPPPSGLRPVNFHNTNRQESGILGAYPHHQYQMHLHGNQNPVRNRNPTFSPHSPHVLQPHQLQSYQPFQYYNFRHGDPRL